jgi:hypothetical protein
MHSNNKLTSMHSYLLLFTNTADDKPYSRVLFRALTDIAPGTELQINYGDCYWETDSDVSFSTVTVERSDSDSYDDSTGYEEDSYDDETDDYQLEDMSDLLSGVQWGGSFTTAHTTSQ